MQSIILSPPSVENAFCFIFVICASLSGILNITLVGINICIALCQEFKKKTGQGVNGCHEEPQVEIHTETKTLSKRYLSGFVVKQIGLHFPTSYNDSLAPYSFSVIVILGHTPPLFLQQLPTELPICTTDPLSGMQCDLPPSTITNILQVPDRIWKTTTGDIFGRVPEYVMEVGAMPAQPASPTYLC